MSKNATGPQVDQNREDDGQLAHQATPTAVGHEADTLRGVPTYYKTWSQVSYLLLYLLATYNIWVWFGWWGVAASLVAFYPLVFLFFVLIVFPINEFLDKKSPDRLNY